MNKKITKTENILIKRNLEDIKHCAIKISSDELFVPFMKIKKLCHYKASRLSDNQKNAPWSARAKFLIKKNSTKKSWKFN